MKYELTNFCEIDKYASESYSRIHKEPLEKNLGDISLVDTDKIKDFDLLVGGSPCQDLSLAGKKSGAMYTCKNCGHKYNPLEAHYSKRDKCPICGSNNLEKTRSSLIVEYLRFLREKQPMFAIYENVKNIIGKDFKPMFDLFIKEIKEIGYIPYWEVLNAKYYGIPQNRERVIGVFIRKDIDHGYTYPKKLEVLTAIKDITQDNVPLRYYISKEKTDPLIRDLILRGKLLENQKNISDNMIHQIGLLGNNGFEQGRRVYDNYGISPTLCSSHAGIKVLETSHRAFNMNPSKRGMSGCVYNVDGLSPTITTSELKILYPEKVVVEYRTDKNYIMWKDNVCGTLRTIDSCGCKRIIEPINIIKNKNINEKNFDYNFETCFEYQDIESFEQDNQIPIFKVLKTYFYKNNKLPSWYNLNTNNELIFGENDKNVFSLNEKQKKYLLSIWSDTGYRVRKLTPREAFRLMGFKDEYFEAARYYTDEERINLDKSNKKYQTELDLNGIERAIKLSDTQAYKEAGNSIVVNILYYVFKELNKQYTEFKDGIKICSLFSGIGAFEQGLAAVNNEEKLLKVKRKKWGIYE